MQLKTIGLISCLLLFMLPLIGSCSKVIDSTTISQSLESSTSSQTTESILIESTEPIAIISAIGPLPPINPGGPIVEITLQNISTEPVISLSATLDLKLNNPANPYVFAFDVTSSNPVLPGGATSYSRTLINGGFSSDVSYPLTIDGTLQDGKTFDYTQQVQILKPPPST